MTSPKPAIRSAGRYDIAAWTVLSAAICLLISSYLHRPIAGIAWLALMGLWAWQLGRASTGSKALNGQPEYSGYGLLLIVMAGAAAVRVYQLTALPLGAFVDEIFTLNSSLLLLEKPVDLFGHTLALSPAWGKDHPNLYLYLNLLVLKGFGVSYGTTKLLSVIPGVIGCGAFVLLAQRLFSRQLALATGLLFAFGHWSIRLNRYGWDVSIMIVTFAVAMWLACLALESGRLDCAYFCGIAAGLGLYSYLAARIVVLSLAGFWILEVFIRRERTVRRQAAAFMVGAGAAAYPFLNYYFLEPGGFWARTSEVSVFGTGRPVEAIANNIVRHALMLHWMGGTFARDNVPGLPMMDLLTGLVFIAGLILLVRRIKTPVGRLLWCALLLNFAGGVFSASQEGAPYVYRTSAVIVPALLIAGFGLEWLAARIGQRWLWAFLSVTIALNLYLYFGLEAKNVPAMRVMAYEPRLIGLEIARDSMPVWLIEPDVLRQSEVHARPDEKYAASNPAVLLAPDLARLAIVDFSGRYDLARSLSQNLDSPRDIRFIGARAVTNGGIKGPARIIFKSGDAPVREAVSKQGMSLREIPNVNGEPLLIVATLP